MIITPNKETAISSTQQTASQESGAKSISVATNEVTTNDVGSVTLADDVVTLSDGQAKETLAGMARPVATTASNPTTQIGGDGDIGGPPSY